MTDTPKTKTDTATVIAVAEKVKRDELLAKFITDNNKLDMPEFINKLKDNKDFTDMEKYSVMWTTGAMMGRAQAVAKIVNKIYNIVDDE
jgi:hypothetical protein